MTDSGASSFVKSNGDIANEWKLALALGTYASIFISVGDILSDVLYLAFVPFESDALFGLAVCALVLPHLAFFLFHGWRLVVEVFLATWRILYNFGAETEEAFGVPWRILCNFRSPPKTEEASGVRGSEECHGISFPDLYSFGMCVCLPGPDADEPETSPSPYVSVVSEMFDKIQYTEYDEKQQPLHFSHLDKTLVYVVSTLIAYTCVLIYIVATFVAALAYAVVYTVAVLAYAVSVPLILVSVVVLYVFAWIVALNGKLLIFPRVVQVLYLGLDPRVV